MALTASTQDLEIGASAPDFSLPDTRSDTQGNMVSRADFAGRPLLVAVICNHCPYVVHLKEAFARFAEDHAGTDLGIVAINANDAAAYPDDAPARMAEDADRYGYAFPYLHDETQAVARAYGAVCTPEFYLFDRDHRLFYRGQFDDSRPNNGKPVTGADLRRAADAVLGGDASPANQVPSVGCSIKWKPGNAPG